MPTRNSRVIGVRLDNTIIEQVLHRAARRGWTYNRWMNWAVKQGLRKHVKIDKTGNTSDYWIDSTVSTSSDKGV